MNLTTPFTSKGPLTSLIKAKGISNLAMLIEHVQTLPYGRNSERSNFSQVITEERGSCSSKHALIAEVANLNNYPDIKLILGLYKMTEQNTIGIGSHLTAAYLEYIPEAHCYLSLNGKRLDITNIDSDITTIEKDIIQEIEIQPSEVVEFKVNYHRDYLKQWIITQCIEQSFEAIWAVRESCIKELSQ